MTKSSVRLFCGAIWIAIMFSLSDAVGANPCNDALMPVDGKPGKVLMKALGSLPRSFVPRQYDGFGVGDEGRFFVHRMHGGGLLLGKSAKSEIVDSEIIPTDGVLRRRLEAYTFLPGVRAFLLRIRGTPYLLLGGDVNDPANVPVKQGQGASQLLGHTSSFDQVLSIDEFSRGKNSYAAILTHTFGRPFEDAVDQHQRVQVALVRRSPDGALTSKLIDEFQGDDRTEIVRRPGHVPMALQGEDQGGDGPLRLVDATSISTRMAGRFICGAVSFDEATLTYTIQRRDFDSGQFLKPLAFVIGPDQLRK